MYTTKKALLKKKYRIRNTKLGSGPGAGEHASKCKPPLAHEKSASWEEYVPGPVNGKNKEGEDRKDLACLGTEITHSWVCMKDM